jgi:DNA primase
MKYSSSHVEQIKSAADIVHIIQGYVKLKKAGSNFLGLCPFHSEKTPSFHVRHSPPYYYCFGCSAKGDVFSFIQAMERISFPETVKFLADKVGVVLPRNEAEAEHDQTTRERLALIELHRLAGKIFKTQLYSGSDSKQVLAYLETRGLSRATLEKFEIGYAPAFSDNLVRKLSDNSSKEMILKSGLAQVSDVDGRYFDRFRKRVIFPIRNESGKTIAFGGRIFGEGQPKYLNSPESLIYSKGKVLYALDFAKDAIRRKNLALLVEGYMDCIALHQSGFENVVASCGTALTEQQVRLLNRFTNRVVVNFDPDAAGASATLRSLGLFLENGFNVKVLVLPEGNDPDAFVRQSGSVAYQKVLEKALPCLEYLISRARSENDIKTIDGKIGAVNQILPYLTMISDRIEREEQIKYVAEYFSLEETLIREALKKISGSKQTVLEIKRDRLHLKLSPSEAYLLKAILDSELTAQEIFQRLSLSPDYVGLQSENIFREAISIFNEEGRVDPEHLLGRLKEDRERDWVTQALFSELNVDEAFRCLEGIKRQKTKLEIDQLQKEIRQAELSKDFDLLASLHSRKTALKRSMVS